MDTILVLQVPGRPPAEDGKLPPTAKLYINNTLTKFN